MPAIETDCRHQKAVYWAASGVDKYGNPTLAAAVELDVRWEYVDTQTFDSQGNPVAISASVVVDRDIPVGSIMWKGDQDDLPSPETDLMRVETFKNVPDVKGKNFRKTVMLSKHSDTLPDLA